MESLNAFRGSVGDAFTTLPLLLIGFTFFLGTLTSNIGLLYLFLGQLILVPALSFLGNEKGFLHFVRKGDAYDTNNYTKGVKWVLSVFLFFIVNSSGLQAVTGSSAWSSLWVALLIPMIGQLYSPNNSVFDCFNPSIWLGATRSTSTPGPACGILPPTEDPTDKTYNSPSQWLNHIVFFFGFIFANVSAVYNEPPPPPSSDPDAQARIDLRVANRKRLTGWIGFVAALVFVILLVFRFRKTECEESLKITAIPLILALITGTAWFNIVYKKCGVRPADVLGIVNGMISTDLIDNPIVCVTS